MYASMVNQVDVVDVLLKKKASPTVQDIVGQTPLHLAASHVRDYLPLSLSLNTFIVFRMLLSV